MVNQSEKDFLREIFDTENDQIRKLNEIVADALREQELIAQSIAEQPEETLTTGQRISDKVARFGGSWTFIISFGVILVCWMILNSLILRGAAFDPYPYILLNLVLSCIAAIQAPIIMMSQNRKEEKDRQRAENDYMVNLKAEIEVRNLHEKMNLLMREQFRSLVELQEKQLEMLERIEKRLTNKAPQ